MKIVRRDPNTVLIWDLPASNQETLARAVMDELADKELLSVEQLQMVEDSLLAHAFSRDEVQNSVWVAHHQISRLDKEFQVLVRCKPPLPLRDRDDRPVHFVWVLVSDQPTHSHLDAATEFAHLMGVDPRFRERALQAGAPGELWEAYDDCLAASLSRSEIIPELRPTGRIFGALIQDIKRRLPLYASDYLDGLNSKSLASILFMFFACVAPAIAFGGLLSVMTEGAIGAVEMLVATALCGVVYALFAGQPLTILGSTGPVIIFLGLLYRQCARFEIPYLPTMAWVGLWTMFFLIFLVAIDACSWIRYFTRFTDDTFAALISLIFIYEALADVFHTFTDKSNSYATALLSLVLALGTFMLASNLSRLRRSPYLRRWAREFLADFGPTIAIVSMTAVAFVLHPVELETLNAPAEFATTSGRGWLVNPMAAPTWVWLAAAVPAALMTILLFLDQNITVRLVNSPEYQLQKGSGYHLDLMLVALLVGVCSFLGLPWMVAATVRSLNHVRSLVKLEQSSVDGVTQDRIVGVVENRVTPLLVHILIGMTLLALPLLKLIPMSVLFGLFLFMGVASMSGNQLFERMQLWILDPTHYPPTHYLRAVPARVVHKFTAIQTACLAVLWVVKSSVLGILFPLFIALLVPCRMLLGKFMKEEHLALLDEEEHPADDEYQEAMPG